MHLERALERKTLNDMSRTEVLSLNEAAVELGDSQCVYRSFSAKSEAGKTLDFLLTSMRNELFIISVSPTHQNATFKQDYFFPAPETETTNTVGHC